MNERISKILEDWFIMEPAMFQVLCTHEFVENRDMQCPLRSGKLRLEYNPDFVDEMTDFGLEEAMRTEACRILLKHPYERRPEGCSGQAMSVGSNLVIGDNYNFYHYQIDKPEDFELSSGMPYEWYTREIQKLLPPGSEGGEDNGEGGGQGKGDSDSKGKGNGNGGGNDEDNGNGNGNGSSDGGDGFRNSLSGNASRNRDLSALWEEDDASVMMIDKIIEGCEEWGSIPGNFVEKLKASTKARINWRHMFNGFRASILSDHRRLTRMRPSRRSGFEQMGSVREFDTKLLVAVDVSGSVTSESLSNFYGVINSAFRYGFQSIDVAQFDCGIRSVRNLRKAIKEPLIMGRGGTDFQEPVDFAHKNGYDGLVILTDGYAPEPVIPDNMRCKILWVCQDHHSYLAHRDWMEKYGRVCMVQLN